MEKPNLNNIWETFIPIPRPYNTDKIPSYYELVRKDVIPMINKLLEDGIINWYSFLVHNSRSGGLTDDIDGNLYIHILLGVKEVIKKEDIESCLAESCIVPYHSIKIRKRRLNSLKSISGIDKNLLENNEIEMAWKLIGEISELIIKLFTVHKAKLEIPMDQTTQFLHYFDNIIFMGVELKRTLYPPE